jgi:hypothetical protein
MTFITYSFFGDGSELAVSLQKMLKNNLNNQTKKVAAV